MHIPVIYGIMGAGIAAAYSLFVQVAPDDFDAMQRLHYEAVAWLLRKAGHCDGCVLLSGTPHALDDVEQCRNGSKTSKRLQTRDIFCIVGELHDNNTCVPNHGIRNAVLQQLDHCVLSLTRALQQLHYKPHGIHRVRVIARA